MDPGSDSVFAANPQSNARGDLLLRAEGYRGPSVLTLKYLHSYTKKTASPVRRVPKGGAVLVREKERDTGNSKNNQN